MEASTPDRMAFSLFIVLRFCFLLLLSVLSTCPRNHSNIPPSCQVVAEEFESYAHCGKSAKFAAFCSGIGLIAAVVGVSERLEGAALGH